MQPAEALADLTEVSTQIDSAVILDEAGDPIAATLADDEAARRVARAARALLGQAGEVVRADRRVTQVQVDLGLEAVFVVSEGSHAIAAVTGAEPTVGLVFYDLRSCLRNLGRENERAGS